MAGSVQRWAALAWPNIASNLANYSLGLINVLVAGHVGPEELAGLLLGTMTTNITGFAVLIGLMSAMDTLGAQAFGARQYARVGFVVQRAVLIGTLLALPIALLWLSTESILLWLQQDPAAARLAAQYTRIMILALPAHLVFTAIKRFLQCQAVVQPPFFCSLLVLPIHAALCVVLSRRRGFVGAPMAMVASYNLRCLLLAAYCALARPHRLGTWPGWRWAEALAEWSEYLRLGLPAIGMFCLEWWTFEIMAIFAGMLDVATLAAHSILASFSSLMFQLPMGLGSACATLVGQALGAGNPAAAERHAVFGCGAGLVAGAVVGLLMYAGRRAVIAAYTEDSSTASKALSGFAVVSLFQIVNFFQGAAQGLLRGAGLQSFGAWVVMACNYFVALPLSASLALRTGMGVGGLWLGLLCGYVVVFNILLFRFERLDWQQLARQAVARSTGGQGCAGAEAASAKGSASQLAFEVDGNDGSGD